MVEDEKDLGVVFNKLSKDELNNAANVALGSSSYQEMQARHRELFP